MAAASLAVRISAQIAEFQSEFKNASGTLKKFGDEFEGIATRASAVGTFIGNIAADIAKSVASGLGAAAADAVRLSSEFSNAFTGLSSVASAFGSSADEAKAAAKRLASDGLLPVKDAASGLKNLLAAGFSLPEATKLMDAFKDSAAFGRAGALSFGDAVRTATEGIKNGNSILVDNAGITKNLSQILKEAGFSAQDLSKASSDAGVRQALFNGILKESAAFAGDAQRATETYSGQVSRLGTAYDTLLASLGDAITQNATVGKAIGFVSDQITGLTNSLTTNKRGFDLVSDAVILMVQTLDQSINVIDLLQTGFAGLQRTFNRVAIDILNVGISFAKFGEKSESVMRFLDPQHWSQHTKNITDARDAYESMTAMVKGFEAASKDSQDRSIQWGNALQESRASLRNLTKDLETTKGKTVEFGNSGKPAADQFSAGIASGVGKATKTLENFDKVLEKIGAPHKIGLFSEVGIEVNPKLAFPPEFVIQQEIQDGLRKVVTGMRGITLDVETQVKLPNITLPQTFLQKMFNPAQMGAAIGNAIAGAVQGGGNVLNAAAGSLGQGLTSKFATYLTAEKDKGGLAIGGFLGGAINAVLPGVGALLGPLVGKISSKIAEAFGGPSKGELEGRGIVASFEQQLQSTLSAQTKLDAGNESWKLTTIAVRDAYIAAGRSALEAEAAVAKLWASSRSGADSARLAVLEIQAVMDIAARKQENVSDGVTTAIEDNLDGLGDTASEAAKAIEEALKNIRIETIHIPIQVDGIDVPGLASGGIVRKPTLALVGESGPEAVVPLTSSPSGFGQDKQTLNELRGLRADLRQFSATLPRSVRDAMLLGAV